MAITAKDVMSLRQATGVGMMDAKKAREANDGNMEAATQWLRVQGLASAAKRADREAGEGAVAVVRNGNVAAIVEMRCETDFVAKSEQFTTLVDEIAARVCAEGPEAVSQFQGDIETMLTTLKENISVGSWRERRGRRLEGRLGRVGSRRRRPHRLRQAGLLEPRRRAGRRS